MNQLLLATASLIAIASNALAAENTNASFQATSTLSSTCTISAQAINFGIITQGRPSRAFGEISSLCSKGISYTIFIKSSTETSSETSSFTQFERKMVSSNPQNTDFLTYSLSVNTSSFIGTGSPEINGVIAVIKGINNYVQPDNYFDIVTVNLTY